MEIIKVSYAWNGTLTKRNKTEMIILHHAAAKSCSVADVHQWHLNRKWTGIGYHFFVSRAGKIYRGRPENVVGAHATGYNSKSIGICFEGDYTVQTMTDEQVKAGKELVVYLKSKYNISIVKKHSDVGSTSCPGKNFLFDEIANVNPSTLEENLILSFQTAAMNDGFSFPKFGADGMYGSETKSVMEKCVVKRRLTYKYKNATKLVQRLLCVEQDGKCGPITTEAIKEFQKNNRLKVDGSVGRYTWGKLLKVE